GGVGDEGRLVLDTAIGVAVAEFRRAERVECFGVGRDLGQAERLDALRDRVFIRRSRQGRDGAQKSDRKSRQNQVTTLAVHCFLRFSCFELSLCRSGSFLSKRSRVITPARTKT